MLINIDFHGLDDIYMVIIHLASLPKYTMINKFISVPFGSTTPHPELLESPLILTTLAYE